MWGFQDDLVRGDHARTFRGIRGRRSHCCVHSLRAPPLVWLALEKHRRDHADARRHRPPEVVLSELHGKPIGTNASWDNPKSRNSGSVRLLERMTYDRQDCEVLQYDLQNADRHERHVFASCLQPDRTWKVVWREKGSNGKFHS